MCPHVESVVSPQNYEKLTLLYNSHVSADFNCKIR